MTLLEALVATHDLIGENITNQSILIGYLNDLCPEQVKRSRTFRKYVMFVRNINVFMELYQQNDLTLFLQTIHQQGRQMGFYKSVRDVVINTTLQAIRRSGELPASLASLFYASASINTALVSCDMAIESVVRDEKNYAFRYRLNLAKTAFKRRTITFHYTVVDVANTSILDTGYIYPTEEGTRDELLMYSPRIYPKLVSIWIQVIHKQGWLFPRFSEVGDMKLEYYLGGIV